MDKSKHKFCKWLDGVLERPKGDTRAYCFNIYECEPQGEYSVELAAFAEFDEYDADWACGGSETYASRDDDDEFALTGAGGYKECLALVHDLILCFLENGVHADKLKSAEKVCFGFVDGDLIDIEIKESIT